MGLLFVGLAFLAGLGIASALSKPKGAGPAGAARVGYAGAPGGPKAAPGDVVASFPHARWGRVIEVNGSGANGYRYTVSFSNGTAVELRGAELTR